MSNLRSWLGQKSPEEIEHFLGEIPRLWLEGENLNKLSRLLSNYEFIEAKLNHTEFGIKALIEDYELIDNIDLSHPDYSEQTIQSLKLIQGALRLSRHILSQDATQLAGQLSGRLLDFDTPDIQRLLQQIPQTETTCLRSLRATLNAPTGLLLSTLSGHGDSVNAVAVTPDGTMVISGSSDHTVKVWDLNTGAEIRTLTGHSAPVNAVAVTPDGTKVISGASDNTVRVWSLATGKEILKFNGHSHSVNAVGVTPDGTRVISGASDNTVKVWNSGTGTEILTFNGHSTPIVALAITPDGKKAVSGSILGISQYIIVWNLETGKEELTRQEHRNLVKTVAITYDNHLIYGSDNGAITIFHLESGEVLFLLAPSQNPETREKLYPISRVLSELNRFDPYQNPETKEKLYSIAVAPDGKSLIAVYSDNFSRVWNLETSNKSDQVKFHSQLEGHTAPIVDIAFTPDGKRFISASNDKTLKVWNFGLLEKNNQVINDNNSVNDVTITTDGKQAILALPYNMVRVYNLERIPQNFNFATDKYPYRFSRIQNRFVEIIDKFFHWWIKALAINFFYSLLSLGITLFLIFKHKFYPRIRLNDNFHLLLFVSPVIIGFLTNILFFVKLLVSLIIGNENYKNKSKKYPKIYSNFKVDESSP
ncbi:MAG: WD40 repeat domain-containing protein, partial [Moorea sp. SIO4E2]|uniref:WD40 repeat domain-containing protein n=1 Tax=Moorena sp. SIO4E2 TaxID=2607826 RepID=UPI0013BAA9E5